MNISPIRALVADTNYLYVTLPLMTEGKTKLTAKNLSTFTYLH